MKLEGKVAIVTGGARDLGRAISVKLAAEGAKVCLNYFDNEADAQETLALIKNVGGEAIAVQGDMTKAAAVKNLFAECNKAFGDKVDVLVNVVGGIVGRKKITEQDEDWYDFLMDVNMRSVFLCTREVVPMMPAGGSIVNFSSLAARDGGKPRVLVGNAGQVHHAACGQAGRDLGAETTGQQVLEYPARTGGRKLMGPQQAQAVAQQLDHGSQKALARIPHGQDDPRRRT